MGINVNCSQHLTASAQRMVLQSSPCAFQPFCRHGLVPRHGEGHQTLASRNRKQNEFSTVYTVGLLEVARVKKEAHPNLVRGSKSSKG